jgi:CheY-like chemotaxis protein
VNANILVVDDDLNTSDNISEFLEGSDVKKFIVYSVRTIDEAIKWIEDKSKSSDLEVCILDLMFPPKIGEISGDITDLAQGIKFYQKFLKGKIRTIVLTGALRWIYAEQQIKDMIDDEEHTILLKKPLELERLEEVLLKEIK